MHLGTQDPQHSDDVFKQLAQLGVKHVCSDPAGSPHDWTLDDIKRHQDRLGSFGVSLDMVQLPLSSRPIEQSKSPDILSKGSNRDKQIDSICSLIERVAEAGIHATKYNLNIIGIPRSEDELGRGGSRNSTFRWDKMDQNAAPGMVGVLSEDENWERIDYFLERVVPVAEAQLQLRKRALEPRRLVDGELLFDRQMQRQVQKRVDLAIVGAEVAIDRVGVFQHCVILRV